jgi:site-specific DNA-methyltransferase (adenine-specific)
MAAAPRSAPSVQLALRTLKGRKKPLQIEPNVRQKMDGHTLLRSLGSSSVKLTFFDPQYRSVLDKQRYGNEGARQKGRAALASMTNEDIIRFMRQIERVLVPSGHVMLWVDKFMLGEATHRQILAHFPKLQLVDIIFWNKARPGMGRRSRYCTEPVLVVQKEPIRAKGIWTDHSLCDSWTEYSDRSAHAHAKPLVLMTRLIKAVTKRGDLVCDPCAGSYGVMRCCAETGRTFVGCDLI